MAIRSQNEAKRSRERFTLNSSFVVLYVKVFLNLSVKELMHATFLNLGWKPEVNIWHL